MIYSLLLHMQINYFLYIFQCDFIVFRSLTVHPAAGLAYSVDSSTPRILINRDPVGHDLGLSYSLNDDDSSEYRDVWMQGAADENIIKLAKELGWLDDLNKYKSKMCEESSKLLEESTSTLNSSSDGSSSRL